MRSFRLAIVFACALTGWCQSSGTCSAPNAGLQILTYNHQNGAAMTVLVWYPTASVPSAYSYNAQMSGSVALNGAVSNCAQYPLVIFSHAYGGCSSQSVFLTEEMARRGFIVAAMDHLDAGCKGSATNGGLPPISTTGQGPNFTDPASWNDQSFIDRYQDDEITINNMLSSAVFGPQIDPTRIAMSGHSTGGYDTFGIAGGWSSWLDKRIKVALMLSPYIQPFMSQPVSTMPNVTVPQLYQGGTLDLGITPWINGSARAFSGNGAYQQAHNPKFFVELQGAGHLEFTNKVCLPNSTSTSTVQSCLATYPNAAFIDNYSFDFLNFYLNRQTVSLLWQANPGLATYWRNTPAATVSDASFSNSSMLAPLEIGAAFGDGLASFSEGAASTPLPTSLGGASVNVTDSQGATRPAFLFYASPGQINYLVPDQTANGAATVNVTVGGSVVASGSIQVVPFAPSIFSANGTGAGLLNGFAQSVGSSGVPLYTLPFNPNTLAPNPIDVSAGNTYLVLAATGARGGAGSPAQASIGATPVPVASIGPYQPFVGVDAISLGPLPPSLAGSGSQNVNVTIGGIATNSLTMVIK